MWKLQNIYFDPNFLENTFTFIIKVIINTKLIWQAYKFLCTYCTSAFCNYAITKTSLFCNFQGLCFIWTAVLPSPIKKMIILVSINYTYGVTKWIEYFAIKQHILKYRYELTIGWKHLALPYFWLTSHHWLILSQVLKRKKV